MDRAIWRTTVHGVAKNWTQLSNWALSTRPWITASIVFSKTVFTVALMGTPRHAHMCTHTHTHITHSTSQSQQMTFSKVGIEQMPLFCQASMGTSPQSSLPTDLTHLSRIQVLLSLQRTYRPPSTQIYVWYHFFIFSNCQCTLLGSHYSLIYFSSVRLYASLEQGTMAITAEFLAFYTLLQVSDDQ